MKKDINRTMAKLKKADKHLAVIHLPKLVDLQEQSSFDVNVVSCADCGADGELKHINDTWLAQCSDIKCTNQIQIPVSFKWKAALLWMQKNSSAVDYTTLPFFGLTDLPNNRAREKLKHIDNYIRMNKDKSDAIAKLNVESNGVGLVYDYSYWEALYFWCTAAKSSVKQFKAK
tara:strand:- start:956 stop:1474 length:519 start_codon:yes stop_codon:yes gene_type:complete